MKDLARAVSQDSGEQVRAPTKTNGEVPELTPALQALQQAAISVASSPDFAEAEEVFVRELANFMRADGCATYRWDRYENSLSLEAAYQRIEGAAFDDLLQDLNLYPEFIQVLQARQARQLTFDKIRPSQPEHKFMGERGIQALLLLPIVARDRTLGLVQVPVSLPQRVFTEQEIALAQMLANQIAPAVANILLKRETERRLEEQAALRRANANIASTLDLDSVLVAVAEQMCRVVDGTSAYICRYDDRGKRAVVVAEYISPNANSKEKTADLGVAHDLRHDARFMRGFMKEAQPVVWYADNGDLVDGTRQRTQESGGCSILAVPMRYAYKVFAYAEIWDSRSRRNFDPNQVALVQAIGQQAAIAYDHARLHTELEQKAAELATLNRISRAITSTLEFQATLEIVGANTLNLLDVETVVIALLDKSEQYLHYAAVTGEASKQIQGQRCNLDRSLWGWSVRNSEPILVSDAKRDRRHDPDFDVQSGLQVRSVLSVPLQAKGRTRGAIAAINKRDGTFRKNDLRLLTNIAQSASTALENAILYERARREIEERRIAEQKLDAERQSLAEKVAIQTAELRKANAELEHAVRLKDEFLASMSHELRTPLNAILGIAEGLQDQFYGPLNEKQIRSVQLVEHSGRHLLALINDILDVSKIESGELMLERETISVPSVCAASLQFIKVAANKKYIKVHSQIDDQVTHILADSRRLKQILINLLSNAVKFTPDHGAIGLDVTGDLENEVARFTVWDTGIGIAEEDQPRLFKPFIQLDSSLARQYAGTGLGLSLVKRMTEMHGGTASVESTLGQGSRFTVTIPWQTPEYSDLEEALKRASLPQTTGLHTSQLVHDPTKTRILLAEDDKINAEIFVQFIESLGYQVILAQDGHQAIKLTLQERPALILMDIQMPGMNGLEAIRKVRSQPEIKDIPIIALTALAMAGDQERCLEAGADDYMTKPVPLRQLKKMIRSYLR
jgi:signal transduction histidine kinase/CheY-like chemotaxis protein